MSDTRECARPGCRNAAFVTMRVRLAGTVCQQHGAAQLIRDAVLAERRDLCDAEVTLDGKRAKISGYRNEFATVTALPGGPGYEWSWTSVAYIVARGGAFKS